MDLITSVISISYIGAYELVKIKLNKLRGAYTKKLCTCDIYQKPFIYRIKN